MSWDLDQGHNIFSSQNHLANHPVFNVLYGKIDQTLVNLLHGLFICEINGLDGRVITAEYRTRVHYIHM